MADDFAGNITTVGVLPVGGSIDGTFEENGDVDWFAITLVAGQHFEVSGPWWLLSILFYDAAGQPLPVDFFGVIDPTVTTKSAGFTATTSGTYYVGVSGIGIGATYTLNGALGTGNNPNNVSNLPVLVHGATGSGELGASESEWFAVTLAAGETFVLEGPDYLHAYSATGQQLETVMRPGDAEQFNYFTAIEAGTYYFQTGNSQPGPYAYGASIHTDDYADGVSTYGAPAETPGILNAAGDQASGVIETTSDIDRFNFDLVAGQTVRLQLSFTELHSFLAEIEVSYGGTGFGEGGLFVGQLRAEEGAELIFTAPITGTYHFDVRAGHVYFGGYEVSIETVAAGAAFDGLPSIITPVAPRPPQATVPTTVEWLTGGTYTVAASTTIYAINVDKIDLPPGSPHFGFGGSPAIQVNNFPQQNSTLNNAGVIRHYNDMGKDVAGAGADGVINSGSIIAESVSPYQGVAYTIFGTATAVKLLTGDLDNSGVIHAGATGGNARGIFTQSTTRTITNSGTISAQATMSHDLNRSGYAAAIESGNDINVVNAASGRILAEADGTAVAIYLGRGGSVENHGLIEAHSRGIHSTSIGIVFNTIGPANLDDGSFPTIVNIHNYGVIRADQAIVGGEFASSPTRPQQFVHNHAGGLIEGDILLNLGSDAVRNEGVITGLVDMGEENDLVDTTGGRINGVVDMGGGTDVFIGGSFADVARGGFGNDTLGGHGGEDLLLGGYGDDVLTGGVGADGLYGELGNDRIVTQGGDVVAGGLGNDRIETGDLTFASIAGGAGHDVWALPAGGRVMDLSIAVASNRVSGIEEIAFAGGQTVVVRSADVVTLSGARPLVLSGGATDTAYLVGAWAAGPLVELNGVSYVQFSLSGATVLVQTGMRMSMGVTPPAATGLDAVGAGAAPLPGVLPGADLAPDVFVTQGETLGDIITIGADEVWESQRGGVVLGGTHLYVDVGVINHGTLRSFGSADADIGGPTGSAYGFSGNRIDVFENSGLILASAFGAGNAEAFFGQVDSFAIENDGLVNREGGRIHALAQNGYALAIYGSSVTNAGDIFALSEAGFAVAIASSGRVENRGVIEAAGGNGAIAIDMVGTVINHGDIIAFSPETSPFFSVAITGDDGLVIENNGLIAADIAVDIAGRGYGASTLVNTGTIYGVIAKSYQQLDIAFGGLNVTNSGDIFGSIVVTDALTASTIINSGLIEGDVILGFGDDVYDGRGGTIFGVVSGGGGNDLFTGGAGGDIFEGGVGSNTLDGGDGVDGAFYGGATAGVTVSLAVAGAQNTGGAGIDTLVAIEDLYGSQFADQLTGDGVANLLWGADGNDTLNGGLGDDVLVGGQGTDVLTGGFGNDTVSAVGDTAGVTIHISGGWSLDGWGTYDTLSGLENAIGSAFNDTLVGNGQANTLVGGGGDDWIVGLEGNDVLEGGHGINVLQGGTGVDLASYASATSGLWVNMVAGVYSADGVWDVFFESIEGVRGGSGNDTLFGNDLANRLEGGVGSDALIGGLGDDVLVGEGGEDWLVGGDGNDRLIGGVNDVDVLTGGAGADTFDLGAGAGWDVAFDFNPNEDRFSLGGHTWSGFFVVDADGDGQTDDTLLGYAGGNFVALNVSGLTLAQWNALVDAPAGAEAGVMVAMEAGDPLMAPPVWGPGGYADSDLLNGLTPRLPSLLPDEPAGWNLFG